MFHDNVPENGAEYIVENIATGCYSATMVSCCFGCFCGWCGKISPKTI